MRFTDELEAIGLDCISVAQANLILASPIICSIQALSVHGATTSEAQSLRLQSFVISARATHQHRTKNNNANTWRKTSYSRVARITPTVSMPKQPSGLFACCVFTASRSSSFVCPLLARNAYRCGARGMSASNA
jgi:hypothetical protein